MLARPRCLENLIATKHKIDLEYSKLQDAIDALKINAGKKCPKLQDAMDALKINAGKKCPNLQDAMDALKINAGMNLDSSHYLVNGSHLIN
jgi:hypothetical protein